MKEQLPKTEMISLLEPILCCNKLEENEKPEGMNDSVSGEFADLLPAAE